MRSWVRQHYQHRGKHVCSAAAAQWQQRGSPPYSIQCLRRQHEARGCQALLRRPGLAGPSVPPVPVTHRHRSADGTSQRARAGRDTHTLLSVIDMESSVRASLDISLSFALVAGAKT